MADELTLNETDRKKLDGIVQQMIANKEADADIQFVVNDFKTKYGQKKNLNEPTSGSVEVSKTVSTPQSVPSSESGTRVELPKITLGEETMQQGVAKSDMGMPSREEQLNKAKAETSQNIIKQIPKRTDAQVKKEKELSLKSKVVNYLRKLVGDDPEQEGAPMVTETEVVTETPIDIYEPIKLEVDQLQPNQIREDGIDPELRQRVILDNSKKAKYATKEFQEVEPILKDIKTKEQAKLLLGKTKGEINALAEEVKQGRKEIDDTVKSIREDNINQTKRAELGITDSFLKGIDQTTDAYNMYNAIVKNDDDAIIELGEKAYTEQMLFGDKEGSNVGMVAETLGGQVQPLGASFLSAIISAGNPLVAGGAGVAAYSTLGGGSEALQVYVEARSQGASSYEAMLKAREASGSGFVAGGLEGVLGTTAQVEGVVSKLLKPNRKIAKSVLDGLAEAGVDALGAMGAQKYNNLNAIAQGIKRDENEGVAQQGLAEAAFSLGFKVVLGGANKLTPTTYKNLVNEFGKFPTVITQKAVDDAVREGLVNPEQAQQVQKDIVASNKAQEKLKGVDIPEKVEKEVIDLQTKIDELEAQKKDASPAILPAIEAKIEALSSEIQIKAAIPLTSKERTELNKLQTAKDSNTDYDKVRLKELEARQKAVQKADEEAKAEEAKRVVEAQKKTDETVEVELEPTVTEEKVEAVQTPTETVTEAEVVTPIAPDGGEVAVEAQEVIEDTEYTDFIDKGKVTPERLNEIANKVKNQEQLSPRETEIFADKTGEINKIIATPQAVELTPRGQQLLDNTLAEYNSATPEQQAEMVKKVQGELDRNQKGLDAIGMGLDEDMVSAGQEFLKQVQPTAQEKSIFETYEETKGASKKDKVLETYAKANPEKAQRVREIIDNFDAIKQTLTKLSDEGKITNLKIEC